MDIIEVPYEDPRWEAATDQEFAPNPVEIPNDEGLFVEIYRVPGYTVITGCENVVGGTTLDIIVLEGHPPAEDVIYWWHNVPSKQE
jgi:hypothetical protein